MAGTTQEVATLKSSIKLDLGDSLRKLKSFRTLLKQTKAELDKLPSRQKKLQQQTSSSPSQIKKEMSAERQKAQAFASMMMEEDKLIKKNIKDKKQASIEEDRLAKKQQRKNSEQKLQRDKTGVRARLAGIDLGGDGEAARSIRRLNKALKDGKIANWQYRMEVSKTIAEHRKLANSTDNAYNRFNKMRTAILAAGAAMTPFAAGAAIVETGQTMEKLGIALNVSFGQDATNQMNTFKNIVDETGVSLTAASKSYRNFIVGAKETGFDVKEAEQIFKTFSKASVVFGMSADDTEGVFRA